MLVLESVHAHYGAAHVLHGVCLELAPGQIACLVGRNGAGKSTTLKAIMGLVRPSAGAISFQGERIDGRRPHAIAGRGLAWVPEDRRVFGSLSVEENLRVAAQATRRAGPSRVREALALFPGLVPCARQRASTLSGGQQQMLAIARAVVSRPNVILLDEPTEGLAPEVVRSIRTSIFDMRSSGVAVLLVEQNLQLALSIADTFFVLSRGVVVFHGTRDDLKARPNVVDQYLGVGRPKDTLQGVRIEH